MLESDIRDSACNLNTSLEEKSSSLQNLATAPDFMKKRDIDSVSVQKFVSNFQCLPMDLL